MLPQKLLARVEGQVEDGVAAAAQQLLHRAEHHRLLHVGVAQVVRDRRAAVRPLQRDERADGGVELGEERERRRGVDGALRVAEEHHAVPPTCEREWECVSVNVSVGVGVGVSVGVGVGVGVSVSGSVRGECERECERGCGCGCGWVWVWV